MRDSIPLDAVFLILLVALPAASDADDAILPAVFDADDAIFPAVFDAEEPRLPATLDTFFPAVVRVPPATLNEDDDTFRSLLKEVGDNLLNELGENFTNDLGDRRVSEAGENRFAPEATEEAIFPRRTIL